MMKNINDLFTDEMLKNIIHHIPANLFFKDTECRYQLASNVCHHLNGTDENWTIVGKTDLEVQKDPELAKFYYEDDKEIIKTGKGNRYISKMVFYGEDYYYDIIKEPVKDDNGKVIGIVGLVNDVTDRIKLEKELEKINVTDTLTKIKNRNFIDKWLEEKMPEIKFPFSIIAADCNDLKKVNDVYGHDYGDEVIKQTAELLERYLPEKCTPVRVGGDEFVVFCENTSKEEADLMIKKLLNEEKNITIKDYILSVSYGSYTVEEKENFDYKEVMRLADESMLNYKRNFHLGRDAR